MPFKKRQKGRRIMGKYDVAAFIWPSYTGDEPRTKIFWPEGYGEWQTVKAMKPTAAMMSIFFLPKWSDTQPEPKIIAMYASVTMFVIRVEDAEL